MLEMIDKSQTVKRFMWLTYAVGLLALLICKPEILTVIARLFQAA